MNNINWAQKLSSRKLWCAIAAGVVMVLTAVFGESLTTEVVEVIKYGLYVFIAFILGESGVDAARQVVEKIRALLDVNKAEKEGRADGQS